MAVLAVVAIGMVWQFNRLEREAFELAEAGRDAIKTLSAFGSALQAGDLDAVNAFVDDDYRHEAQDFWTESPRSDVDGARIYDWLMENPGPFGKAEMSAQFERLLARIDSLQFAKFKLAAVERIEADGDLAVRGALWLRGVRDGGLRFESKAAFRVGLARRGERLTLARLDFQHGQTVTGEGVGFNDVAAAAGLDFRGKRNPLFKTPEWYPHRFYIAQYSSAGVSAADYDGDGWQDLFFNDGVSARLYRNLGGRFEDVTAAVGLPEDMVGANTAIFADFDNDGDADLFVSRFTGPSLLFRNDGEAGFTDVAEHANLGRPIVAVASAADYDNDGDLDLYLGRYLDPRINLPTTPFYTRNSEGNSLLRNDGDFRFTDVTKRAGVRDGGLTLGAVWGDYDDDGDADLYVANDFGPNGLYRNNGDGTFDDVALAVGAEDMGFGMSASWGDPDNDGDLDLYVANVHSGQRWYGQAPIFKNYLLTSLKQGTLLEDMPIYYQIYRHLGSRWARAGDHIIKGNSLLINDGGVFTDVSEAARANPFGWYWGSVFFDYDNDGWQDIYSANGWISAANKDDY